MKLLVLKLNKLPDTDEGIRQRAQGDWRITVERLRPVDMVVVLYQTQVVAVYEKGDTALYHFDAGRVTLDLQPADDDDDIRELFLNKRLRYPVPNPATVITKNDLMKLIEH